MQIVFIALGALVVGLLSGWLLTRWKWHLGKVTMPELRAMQSRYIKEPSTKLRARILGAKLRLKMTKERQAENG